MKVIEFPVLVVCPHCRQTVKVIFQPPGDESVLCQGYQGQKRVCPSCKERFIVDVVVYSAELRARDLRHPHASWIGFFKDLIEGYGAAAAVLLLYEGFKAGGLEHVDPRQVETDASQSA